MSESPTTDDQGTPLLIERQGGTVTLRFNRPPFLNAIDVAMAQAVLAAARSLSADPSVRAVVLTGAGKGFMAGGDLQTLSADPVGGAAALIGPLNEALCLFSNMNAPVIAQVHGVAAGAGLSLMLQADFILAAEGTRFNLAYINLGTSCDVGASWALPRMVGWRKAIEIAMLGETFDASEAHRLGIINRVVPAEQLQEQTHALAKRLASGPTQAYGAMKRLMRTSFDRDLPAQLAAESEAFIGCANSQDFRAGVDAFFDKRPPQFTGA
jgi:2-(1,2-epoxy-1,2-dihydrophenyl)acetyl-CoA isomerase